MLHTSLPEHGRSSVAEATRRRQTRLAGGTGGSVLVETSFACGTHYGNENMTIGQARYFRILHV